MKTFERYESSRTELLKEIGEFRTLLQSNSDLKERDEILPFFRQRPHLLASIGSLFDNIKSDRIAFELELFGDFVCDAAVGDSELKKYVLVEFENASKFTIFRKIQSGKTMKRWSPRFEHGFSQLVDWAWRLSTESSYSAAYLRIFEASSAKVNFLLIAGRDADLTESDLNRVDWRSDHMKLGAFGMNCMTFDRVAFLLERRFQSRESQG